MGRYLELANIPKLNLKHASTPTLEKRERYIADEDIENPGDQQNCRQHARKYLVCREDVQVRLSSTSRRPCERSFAMDNGIRQEALQMNELEETLAEVQEESPALKKERHMKRT